MSAIVCGKRSSIFEEIPSQSSSSSSSKRIRCSSSTSPVRFPAPSSFLLLDQLISLFPHMDKKLIEQALENNGHDLDLAIKSLNDLRLACAENIQDDANTSLNTHIELINLAQGGPVNGEEGGEATRNGAEWVELFVSEMRAASDVDDARIRAARALEALEKSIYTRAKAETSQSFQQENLILKEQVEALLQENGILKRAVSIQHERQKEFEAKSQEVQQLKQLLSQCQEHIRTLEVNNYALAMHLKQAQQNNSIPGRFNPDIF